MWPRVWLPAASCIVAAVSCDSSAGNGWSAPDVITAIGEPGRGPGQFVKPRAAAVSPDGDLFVCDRTGRIQRFDSAGNLTASWNLPYVTDPTKARHDPRLAERPAGFPVGMTFDAAGGRLLVADTHYHRVLIYSPDGRLLGTFGEYGTGPGQFVYPTSVAPDGRGFLYVAEYGGNDRIQRFTTEGRYVSEFGGPGSEPGRFSRPQTVLIDPAGNLWVADSCNHRICVFTPDGELLRMIGGAGDGPGRFSYPYGMAFDGSGNLLVAEFGNCRLQKLSTEGRPLDSWGRTGAGIAELNSPWSVVVDSQDAVYVVDSGNNRVLRFRWP